MFTRETGKSMSAGLIGGSLGCYIGQSMGSDLLTLVLIFPLILIGYDIRGLVRSTKQAARMSFEEWVAHPYMVTAKQWLEVPVRMVKGVAGDIWSNKLKLFGFAILFLILAAFVCIVFVSAFVLVVVKALVLVALSINMFKRLSMAVFGTMGAAIFLIVNPMAEASPLVMSLVCGIICSISCGLVSVLLETEERYARAKAFNDLSLDGAVGGMIDWQLDKLFGPAIDAVESRFGSQFG